MKKYKNREDVKKYINCIENNNLYIHGYEDDTINIINKLNSLTNHGIRGYKASFQSFINQGNYIIIYMMK